MKFKNFLATITLVLLLSLGVISNVFVDPYYTATDPDPWRPSSTISVYET